MQATTATKKVSFLSPEFNHLHILLLSFAMILFGILMVYSSSALYAERLKGNEFHFILRHLTHVTCGIFLFFCMAFIHYRSLRRYVVPLMSISLILLIIVLIPYFGVKVYGARRWISLYFFTFQPSEIYKLTILIWMADFLCRKKEHINKFSRSLFPILIIMGIYLMLLLLQPDYGTAVLVALTLLVITLIAGIPFFHLIVVLVTACGLFLYLAIDSAYRLRRIQSFIDPWADTAGAGYQLTNSLIAYGGGGIFGRGFGDSLQKRFYLPQAHTDFIAAVMAEEVGLVGMIFFLVVLTMFIMTGFSISSRSKDPFGRYLAFGITMLIAFQSLFHILVTMGLLPTKGIGLPFISYGGSLTVISITMVGILYNIAYKNRHS